MNERDYRRDKSNALINTNKGALEQRRKQKELQAENVMLKRQVESLQDGMESIIRKLEKAGIS